MSAMPGRALAAPRFLHPAAWWAWALCLAGAASRTTNPISLALILAVIAFVVLSRRSDAPWALAFRLYVWLGIIVVAIRMVYRIVFSAGYGDHVLVTLPSIDLPEWAAGIRLFGTITAESVLEGAFDGLRLATMIICIGAANALANPKRLLKAVPSALYEIGTAIVVALSVFPQLAESVQRVHRARKLRGGRSSKRQALREIVVPVLADALDRSLALAAAMDSRGYGRHGEDKPAVRHLTTVAMVVGVIAVCVGVYGMLDSYTPGFLGLPMVLLGMALAVASFVIARRRIVRSTYRPDPWRLAETVTVACGVAVLAAAVIAEYVSPGSLNPSILAWQWPQPSLMLTLGTALAAIPALAAPVPPATMPNHANGVRRQGATPAQVRTADEPEAQSAESVRGAGANSVSQGACRD